MADRTPHEIDAQMADLAKLQADARNHVTNLERQIASLRHQRMLILNVIRARQATVDKCLDERLEASR